MSVFGQSCFLFFIEEKLSKRATHCSNEEWEMRVTALLRCQVSMLDHRVWWNGLIWNSLTGQSDLFTNCCILGPWLPSIGNKQKRIPGNVTAYHPLLITLWCCQHKTTLNGMNNHEGIGGIVFLISRKDWDRNIMRWVWTNRSINGLIFAEIKEVKKTHYILNWPKYDSLMTIKMHELWIFFLVIRYITLKPCSTGRSTNVKTCLFNECIKTMSQKQRNQWITTKLTQQTG